MNKWWKRTWNVAIKSYGRTQYIHCYGSVFHMVAAVLKLKFRETKGEWRNEIKVEFDR